MVPLSVAPLLLLILLISLHSCQQQQQQQRQPQLNLLHEIQHPAAGHHQHQQPIGIADLIPPSYYDDELPRAPPDTLVGREFKLKNKPIASKKEEKEEEKEEKRDESRFLSRFLLPFFGCTSLVICSILPAYLIPIGTLRRPDAKQLNLLLSFAVGSLLGDVFLHLLPESWNSQSKSSDRCFLGFWTIAGLLLCFLVEKCCASTQHTQHKLCAIMNLVANFIDNFTHGLAIGASFMVNARFGLLTTFAILIHEIPHEISDFAILLRANFNRWSVIKAQLLTATGGIFGAFLALSFNSNTNNNTADWILPFTAGGFLNIALAQILPDLMHETNSRESLKQLGLIMAGILAMGGLNLLHFT